MLGRFLPSVALISVHHNHRHPVAFPVWVATVAVVLAPLLTPRIFCSPSTSILFSALPSASGKTSELNSRSDKETTAQQA
jgi:hypothetical protein